MVILTTNPICTPHIVRHVFCVEKEAHDVKGSAVVRKNWVCAFSTPPEHTTLFYFAISWGPSLKTSHFTSLRRVSQLAWTSLGLMWISTPSDRLEMIENHQPPDLQARALCMKAYHRPGCCNGTSLEVFKNVGQTGTTISI